MYSIGQMKRWTDSKVAPIWYSFRYCSFYSFQGIFLATPPPPPPPPPPERLLLNDDSIKRQILLSTICACLNCFFFSPNTLFIKYCFLESMPDHIVEILLRDVKGEGGTIPGIQNSHDMCCTSPIPPPHPLPPYVEWSILQQKNAPL